MSVLPTPLAKPQDLFSLLTSSDLEDLLGLTQTHVYKKTEFIFRAGDPGRHIYFLQSGRVKIFQVSPKGKEIILWFCFPGEICGLAEAAGLQGGSRTVSAIACDRTAVLKVPHEMFQDYLLDHPHASLAIIHLLSCRLRGLGDMTLNLISDDVQTRVAKLILRLSAHYGRRVGSEVLLDMPLTHQEMADMIGTTRQSFTSVLNEFKRLGILSLGNRRIHIESEKSLTDLSKTKLIHS